MLSCSCTHRPSTSSQAAVCLLSPARLHCCLTQRRVLASLRLIEGGLDGINALMWLAFAQRYCFASFAGAPTKVEHWTESLLDAASSSPFALVDISFFEGLGGRLATLRSTLSALSPVTDGVLWLCNSPIRSSPFYPIISYCPGGSARSRRAIEIWGAACLAPCCSPLMSPSSSLMSPLRL